MRSITARNKKRLFLLKFPLGIFLCLFCVGAGSCQTDDERYDKELKECVEVRHKQTGSGIECLQNLIAKYPNKQFAHLFLARRYHESGQIEKAENSINIFVAAYPSYASGFKTQCEIYRDKKNFQEALLACGKAMSLEPEKAEHKRTVASLYEAQGEFERAENWYLQTLKINPDDQTALVALGRLYEKTENLDKAIETYEKLLKYDDFEFKEKLQEGIKKLKDKKEILLKEQNKENQKTKTTKP